MNEKEKSRAYYLKNRDRILKKLATPKYKELNKKACARYRASHKARISEYGRIWRKKNKQRILDNHRKRKYGVGPDEFRRMVASQGGCPGCLDPHPTVIDHDHACCPGAKSCGKCVRGVFCRMCNVTLGMAKDSPAILRRLANWLEDYYD